MNREAKKLRRTKIKINSLILFEALTMLRNHYLDLEPDVKVLGAVLK